MGVVFGGGESIEEEVEGGGCCEEEGCDVVREGKGKTVGWDEEEEEEEEPEWEEWEEEDGLRTIGTAEDMGRRETGGEGRGTRWT